MSAGRLSPARGNVSREPKERVRGLAPRERLEGLSAEERLEGLSPEELERLRLLLQKQTKGEPPSPLA
jgi:hypothetical protein